MFDVAGFYLLIHLLGLCPFQTPHIKQTFSLHIAELHTLLYRKNQPVLKRNTFPSIWDRQNTSSEAAQLHLHGTLLITLYLSQTEDLERKTLFGSTVIQERKHKSSSLTLRSDKWQLSCFMFARLFHSPSCSFETKSSTRVQMLKLSFQTPFLKLIYEYKYMNIINLGQHQ